MEHRHRRPGSRCKKNVSGVPRRRSAQIHARREPPAQQSPRGRGAAEVVASALESVRKRTELAPRCALGSDDGNRPGRRVGTNAYRRRRTLTVDQHDPIGREGQCAAAGIGDRCADEPPGVRSGRDRAARQPVDEDHGRPSEAEVRCGTGAVDRIYGHHKATYRRPTTTRHLFADHLHWAGHRLVHKPFDGFVGEDVDREVGRADMALERDRYAGRQVD